MRGGYHKGLGAQEEALSYASTLSCSLYQYGDIRHRHIKAANLYKECKYPLGPNFGGIYAPKARFFRDGPNNFYAISERSFDCSIITVSSLDNHSYRYFDNEERKYFKWGFMTEEGKIVEMNRIRTILRIAIENGHDSLILGAFGCGVYECKPAEVVKLFYLAFNEKEFKNKFKKVTFAILEGNDPDTSGPNGKFGPFYRYFGKK